MDPSPEENKVLPPETSSEDDSIPSPPPIAAVPKESLRKTIYLRSRNKKKQLQTIIEEEVTRIDSK